MFNVTVLKLKDIIKFAIEAIIVIVIILICSKIYNKNFKGVMKDSIHVMSVVDTDEENNQSTQIEEFKTAKYFEKFIDTGLSSTKIINKNENVELSKKENNNELVENIEENIEENGETVPVEQTEISENLKTEVVTENPLKLVYNAEFKNVKIKNETSYELGEDVLNPDVKIENKNIILFHTHTCESYTSSEKYPYTPTGTFRTTDLNFSVARVGDELENNLKQYGFNVIHNKTYHDYPSYNGSYTRSLETVTNILKDNPSQIVWDVHRDAIGSRSDYAPTVKIGDDDYAAQIMFVIGTNEGGLWHPNWQQNLKFAVKVQQKAEEMYPGLFKPMLVTKSRYNQHSAKYAGIIEVGATGNTLEQCLTSMKYLAKVMDEVLKN
ncbi:MAG: stage II sporulation protein P [Clostridia bacterium]|nr:stage II sporulation protein P [Clostridia bacterium]